MQETASNTKSGLTTPFINKDNLQKGDRQNVIGSNPVGKQEKKVSIINKFSWLRRKRNAEVHLRGARVVQPGAT